MSLNRCKNVFTLGNFHFPPVPQQNAKNKSKQRLSSDPFARDPFKIQSYNFRYAERPIFPLPDLQQRPNNHKSVKDCQTFFYNYDFPRNSNVQKSAIRNDNCTTNLTKFQEYRRKKFLQDQPATRNYNLKNSFNNLNNNNGRSTNCKPYNSNILNLYYESSRPQQNYDQILKSDDFCVAKTDDKPINSPNNISQNFYKRQHLTRSSGINVTQKESNKNPRSPPMTSQTHESVASTSRLAGINCRRSLSSGCEININIKGIENNTRSDNVIIKIETDSIGKNLDIPKTNRLQSSTQSIHKLPHLESSKSFVIDKTLSKFSVNSERKELFRRPVESSLERKITLQSLPQQEQKCLRAKQRERVKALTSVYCPQLGQTSTKKRMEQSSERIPSMIPFRSKSDIGKYNQHKMENLPPTKKSFLQKVKDNLNYSLTDIKPTTASKLSNDLHNCSTKSLTNEKKILNSSLLTAKESFLKKFNASKHSSRSRFTENSLHSLPDIDRRPDLKLSVSVNINVFADKCKLLKD